MGLPYTVTRYMRENGISWWSTGPNVLYESDPRIYHARTRRSGPIQSDVYPSTLEEGEVTEILKWYAENVRRDKEFSRACHRLFLVSAGLAHKEKED